MTTLWLKHQFPLLTNRIPELCPAHRTRVLKWSALIRNLLDNMIKLLLLPWFEVDGRALCCGLRLPRRSEHRSPKFTDTAEIQTRAEIPTQQQSSLPRHANYQASELHAHILIRQVRMHRVQHVQRWSTSSMLNKRGETCVCEPSWAANGKSNYHCRAETNQLASTLGCDTPTPRTSHYSRDSVNAN